MGIIIVIIIILYVCYKVADVNENQSDESISSTGTSSEEDDVQTSEENMYSSLTNEKIVELYSKITGVPNVRTGAISAKELSRESMYHPLTVEKLVGTGIMMEDYVNKIYIKEGRMYIELGDGHSYRDVNFSNTSIFENYICEIAAYEDTLENLKIGDRVWVVGVLGRKHSGYEFPQMLYSAIVVKIYWEFVPVVAERLLEEENVEDDRSAL